MKDVGIKLRDKREELNLTYEEVSKMTKLPSTTIKAIEEGNLDHFQNDLTYVRFYVRSYCKAIDVPYEHFKDDVLDSVEEYTNTMSLNALKKHEEMEANITSRKSEKNVATIPDDKKPRLAKKDRSSIAQNTSQNRRFTKKKRIDFAFLSLIIVIALIVCIVIGLGIKTLLSDNNKTPSDDPITENQPNTPQPEEDEPKDEKEEKEDKEADKVKFEAVSPISYTVGGLKVNDDLKIEVTFKNQGTFNLWRGSASVPNASNIYNSGATYTFEGKVVANEVFTFNFWNYGGATIKVNGKTLEYDEKAVVPDAQGVAYFTLTMKGE